MDERITIKDQIRNYNEEDSVGIALIKNVWEIVNWDCFVMLWWDRNKNKSNKNGHYDKRENKI